MQKIEKDKMTVRLQLDDTRAATDHIFHEKAVADKNLKALDAQIGVLQKKIDENSLVSDKEKKAQRAGPHTQTLRCPVVCSFSGVNVRSRRLH